MKKNSFPAFCKTQFDVKFVLGIKYLNCSIFVKLFILNKNYHENINQKISFINFVDIN